jgi:hypothetical protein
MNKIERAIYDIELHISKLIQERMILNAKIEAYKEHLDALDRIQRDETVPNVGNS